MSAPVQMIRFKVRDGKRSARVAAENGIPNFLNKEVKFFEKKFGARQKSSLYEELGLLLQMGVDIKSAFDIIIDEISDKTHRKIVGSIRNLIIMGSEVHAALATYPSIFTPYEVHSVRIGEETGQLGSVLMELGTYYNTVIKLRRQIVGILTYPVVVIIVAILIVYFMMSVVVPTFSDIFLQTGAQLPGITKLLIKISDRSSLIFLTMFLMFGSMATLHFSQKNRMWYRKFMSSFVMKVPVVNKLVHKIYLTRFCQTMTMLTKSKVLLNDSLELVQKMIGFFPMEQAIEAVRRKLVVEGRQLNECMGEFKIFPKKLIALIKLSEEVNAPAEMFQKMHLQYSSELEHQQLVLGKLIEPVFIVLLGVFVGFILLAMYLPMFEMSTNNFR